MAVALARFQDDFAAALLDPDAGGAGAGGSAMMASLARQPGFAVYRNTVMKGCIDALQANFPAIVGLVGEEWFRAAAAVHARAQPPQLPMLALYGDTFADFLAHFKPARDYPYLPGVARLDRLWSEAHVARDAPLPGADELARLAPVELAGATLAPHPAARWRWFPDLPIYTIWRRNREGAADLGELDWHGEGALITRGRNGAVRHAHLGIGGCAFLDACAAGTAATGGAFGDAAEAALAAEPGINLARLMATLLEAGALAQLHPGPATSLTGELP